MPCPPIPPPPVEVPADAPTTPVPVPTLHWLAARDLYAEELTACMLSDQAAHTLTLAELEAARWVAADNERRRRIAEQDLRIARRRPTWPVVVGLVVVSAGAGVYAWEIAR